MRNSPLGELIFKLVAIPFILLLTLLIAHQSISLMERTSPSSDSSFLLDIEFVQSMNKEVLISSFQSALLQLSGTEK